MKKFILMVSIVLIGTGITYAQSKKDIEVENAKLKANVDSLSGALTSLTAEYDSLVIFNDSVNAVLEKHRTMYNTIKEKVLIADFDPEKFGEIIDSLQGNRDSLFAGQTSIAARLKDTLNTMNNMVDSLSARVKELEAENEKLTFFITQIKGEMGLEEIKEAPGAEAAGTDISTLSDAQFNQLKKLKELLDAGIITKEEFDVKKHEILK